MDREDFEERNGRETSLTAELYELLQQESARQESFIRFISLNQRSLVGGITPDQKKINTAFLDHLLNHLHGGDDAASIWSPCLSCSAKERCEVFRAMRRLWPGQPASSGRRQCSHPCPRAAVPSAGSRWCTCAVRTTHITVRELRAALVYIVFGIHFCDDYHAGTEDRPLPYWDRAFASVPSARQGEVLQELAVHPALEAHPQVDRHLLSRPVADDGKTAPRYSALTLASARRRAFFEWTREDVKQVAGDADALDLARGQHLRPFRNLPLETDPVSRATICERLCAGISRLEDLPPQALDRRAFVPLRITPRTPTETAFWVEKVLDAFRLETDLPPEAEGIERLHRQVHLIYRYRDGNEERLRMGAELFHLLLELADGYQLGDVSTDDTFANLSIFVQRRRKMSGSYWHEPMQDEVDFRVAAVTADETSAAAPR